MHLAKRMSFVVALAVLGAGAAACKKDEKKDEAKTEEKQEGTEAKVEDKKEGAEAKVEDKVEEKKEEAPPPEAQKAMKGFAIAVDKAPDQPGAGGGLGGMGSMFGSMFGGGSAADAPAAPTTPATAPEPTAAPTRADEPAPGPAPTAESSGSLPADLKLPPAAPAGGDCTAVTDRLMLIVEAVVQAELGKLPADQRQMVEGQMGEFREQMKTEVMNMCTSQNWSQELKDCMLTAADVPSLEKCEAMMPKDAAAQPPEEGDYTAAVAAPTAEAPPWTGGNSCEDAGKRMMQIYMLSVGDTSAWDAETKKQVEAQLDEGAKQFAQACNDANFSEAVRNCLVQSNTLEATEACWALIGQ